MIEGKKGEKGKKGERVKTKYDSENQKLLPQTESPQRLEREEAKEMVGGRAAAGRGGEKITRV